MMTKRERTKAVKAIRARVNRDDVLDPVAVTTPWKATPPFVPMANRNATRGHAEFDPKDAPVKTRACGACLQDKPRGGWSAACPSDRRVFQGG